MRLHLKGTKMLFYVKYQVDRDKQSDTQAFFANMSEEEREKEVGYWAQGGMDHEPNNEPEGDG